MLILQEAIWTNRMQNLPPQSASSYDSVKPPITPQLQIAAEGVGSPTKPHAS